MISSKAASFLRRAHDNRFVKPIKDSIVRFAAGNRIPRGVLNQYYDLLGVGAKSRFHWRYAKIFRGQDISISPGEWHVHFNGSEIRLPLRRDWAWLDWDIAVSIVGHDVEVVETYEALIASDQRPTLFLDVGANYGMHSILFLSAGIPAISFEPNATCFELFRGICETNGLSSRWEQVAIGDSSGEIVLTYPEKDAWLGSVSSDVVPGLGEFGNLTSARVPLTKLDDYLGEIPGGTILIKIDVEGFENEVLKGASRLLRMYVPKIIFESTDVRKRKELFCFLDEYGYRICSLPWRPSIPSQPLPVEDFLASVATNFIAIPCTSERC